MTYFYQEFKQRLHLRNSNMKVHKDLIIIPNKKKNMCYKTCALCVFNFSPFHYLFKVFMKGLINSKYIFALILCYHFFLQ